MPPAPFMGRRVSHRQVGALGALPAPAVSPVTLMQNKPRARAASLGAPCPEQRDGPGRAGDVPAVGTCVRSGLGWRRPQGDGSVFTVERGGPGATSLRELLRLSVDSLTAGFRGLGGPPAVRRQALAACSSRPVPCPELPPPLLSPQGRRDVGVPRAPWRGLPGVSRARPVRSRPLTSGTFLRPSGSPVAPHLSAHTRPVPPGPPAAPPSSNQRVNRGAQRHPAVDVAVPLRGPLVSGPRLRAAGRTHPDSAAPPSSLWAIDNGSQLLCSELQGCLGSSLTAAGRVHGFCSCPPAAETLRTVRVTGVACAVVAPVP